MAYDDDGVNVEVEDDIHKHANLNNEAPLAIQQYYGLGIYTFIYHYKVIITNNTNNNKYLLHSIIFSMIRTKYVTHGM